MLSSLDGRPDDAAAQNIAANIKYRRLPRGNGPLRRSKLHLYRAICLRHQHSLRFPGPVANLDTCLHGLPQLRDSNPVQAFHYYALAKNLLIVTCNNLVACRIVGPQHELMIMSNEGVIIRVKVPAIEEEKG